MTTPNQKKTEDQYHRDYNTIRRGMYTQMRFKELALDNLEVLDLLHALALQIDQNGL